MAILNDKSKAILVFNEQNRFYFTSFYSTFGCVIVTDEKKIFMTDKRYTTDAAKFCKDCEIITVGGDELYPKIKELLDEMNVSLVGIETSLLSVATFEKIKGALPGVSFFEADDIISNLQIIKREEEIEHIEKAEWITQKALMNTLPKIKPGVTEKAIAAEIVYQMMLLGAEGPSFDSIVCFGPNSACPHHKPSDTKLEKNDIILIDIGAKYKGYCGDMTRTFCVGTPSKEFERMHRAVKEAQEFALKWIKAGMACKDVDMLARENLASNGLKEAFTHSLGHGVGVNIHENPRMSPNSNEILAENMVVSVEPGVYIEGVGGVRIEDLVVVKQEGVTNLTTLLNKNIII